MGVSSCCGCCSVKAGVITIGVLTSISGIILAINTIFRNSYLDFRPISAAVCLVFGILLIIGAIKRKSSFVFPSLCLYFVNIVLNIPEIFIVQLRVYGQIHASTAAYFIIIIIFAIGFALSIYIFMVLKTYYKELLREEYAAPRIDQQRV